MYFIRLLFWNELFPRDGPGNCIAPGHLAGLPRLRMAAWLVIKVGEETQTAQPLPAKRTVAGGPAHKGQVRAQMTARGAVSIKSGK